MAKDTLVDSLAKRLAIKLGREVTVHRLGHGGGFRYSIRVPGCVPEAFRDLTVGEAKGRLAMLADMLSSGVIQPGPK